MLFCRSRCFSCDGLSKMLFCPRLCSAHVPLSLQVREIPVDSHLGMLPCCTSACPRCRILGFERQVPQKHVSSPSWVSFLSIFLGTLSAEAKFG